MKIRIGIIGCGRIAQRFHIASALNRSDAELVALCDNRKEILMPLASKYKVSRTTTRYEDLLNDETVDCVLVTTPAYSHFEILREAMKLGKHVFVEKPLVQTQDEENRIAEISQNTASKVMVGFMRRFDKALVWTQERLIDKSLGELIGINSSLHLVSSAYREYLAKSDKQISGNFPSSQSYKDNLHAFLSNQLIHQIDMLLWMGGRVEKLLATAILRDSFSLHVLLRFSNGILGHLNFAGFVDNEWNECLSIHGSNGSIFAKLFFPYTDTPTSAILSSRRNGIQAPMNVVNTMYEDELAYFLTCVKCNTQPTPGVQEALNAHKVISSIEESLGKESWVNNS